MTEKQLADAEEQLTEGQRVIREVQQTRAVIQNDRSSRRLFIAIVAVVLIVMAVGVWRIDAAVNEVRTVQDEGAKRGVIILHLTAQVNCAFSVPRQHPELQLQNRDAYYKALDACIAKQEAKP